MLPDIAPCERSKNMQTAMSWLYGHDMSQAIAHESCTVTAICTVADSAVPVLQRCASCRDRYSSASYLSKFLLLWSEHASALSYVGFRQSVLEHSTKERVGLCISFYQYAPPRGVLTPLLEGT